MDPICEINFEFFYDRDSNEEILCLMSSISGGELPHSKKQMIIFETSEEKYPMWVNKDPLKVPQGI